MNSKTTYNCIGNFAGDWEQLSNQDILKTLMTLKHKKIQQSPLIYSTSSAAICNSNKLNNENKINLHHNLKEDIKSPNENSFIDHFYSNQILKRKSPSSEEFSINNESDFSKISTTFLKSNLCQFYAKYIDNLSSKMSDEDEQKSDCVRSSIFSLKSKDLMDDLSISPNDSLVINKIFEDPFQEQDLISTFSNKSIQNLCSNLTKNKEKEENDPEKEENKLKSENSDENYKEIIEKN